MSIFILDRTVFYFELVDALQNVSSLGNVRVTSILQATCSLAPVGDWLVDNRN